ncbi:MAG: M48 family metallopeptidase [Saprospiraceae bacterium]|nr:M48 family metallopeptidase [Saprospiraceae bacterium]
MKHLNYLFLLLLPYFGSGQETVSFLDPIRAIVRDKIENKLIAGDTVLLTSLSSINFNGSKLISFTYNDVKGFQHSFDYKYFRNLDIASSYSISQKWQHILLKTGVYESLIKNEMQYDIRNELNEDAISYVEKLKNENRIFSDPYFEDYLYTLSTKIHPGILKDGRPGNIYILMIKDPSPNAFALPNGTIIFSTGLLSTIQSEDELVGILAHEISHFVLDHHVINYNKIIERKKKAEFWAGLATVVSAGADIYLSSKYSDYIPGMLTASTAILSSIISNEVLERLGIKYNREQEFEADKVAAEIIDHIKGNKIGLSAALMRLKNFSIISGDYASLYDSRTTPKFGWKNKSNR